jgi:hypothetical protein
MPPSNCRGEQKRTASGQRLSRKKFREVAKTAAFIRCVEGCNGDVPEMMDGIRTPYLQYIRTGTD